MKILNSQQIREIDAYTIENEPISSNALMERAAVKCYEWIVRRMPKKRTVKVFCGMGNNGGDGLVIARLLAAKAYHVKVYKILHSDSASEDFLLNEKRLAGIRGVDISEISGPADLPGLESSDIIVDAILGSGIKRPAEGIIASVIHHINSSGAVVVSVDMPSGLFCEDNRNNKRNNIIKADYTLSFQFPRLAFMMASSNEYIGRWYIIDIGLHPDAIYNAETRYFFLQASDIKTLYRKRRKFSHKGNYGHAFLLAGSYGKTGAAVLASRAVMRSGAGLLTVQVPASSHDALQTAVPEAMCRPDGNSRIISELDTIDGFNAIGIGPGIGKDDQTSRVLKMLIQNATVPMVIDADALNILADNLTWCGFLPKGSIFTPHPGEFDRLAGRTSDDHDRLETAIEFSRRFQVYVVLKGAHTAIISPDGKCYFNSTGNPGMATGGSGDVLTGMILGFMAQNYSPLHSCLMAVYLHGRAGDLAAGQKGYEGLVAGDIVDNIPAAIKTTLR